MTQSYLPSRWLITAPNFADDVDVFPLLPGFGFVASKQPQWNTAVSQASSGRERRRMAWSYPLWNFKVAYEVLRDGPNYRELERLQAFFNAHAGKYAEFFFCDPSDNHVADQRFGTGDGVTTGFQLNRTIGAGNLTFAEPVRGLFNTPIMKVDGAVTSGFTIGPLGRITFASPPNPGTALTWSGNFLFLCRFDQDDLDTQQLMQGLWSQSGLAFVTVKS
ncbi:DUF2460 domain-containing protein [Sphingomonas sp. MMS24-J13]|uniref:DUF2460 domain-containing protein n=1 Tax=Sphingomonas sp. MMS24-J13 TaxID=3238686 RepID=UPI00385112BA